MTAPRTRASASRFLLTITLVSIIAGCAADSTSPPQSSAATAVAAAPKVKVVDENGLPVAGVTVEFSVTAGGGAVTQNSATTDANGTADAGAWTLGTTAGTNTVDATVATMPTVRFTATGVADVPASIAAAAKIRCT